MNMGYWFWGGVWLVFTCWVIAEIVKQLRKPRGKGFRMTAREKYRRDEDDERSTEAPKSGDTAEPDNAANANMERSRGEDLEKTAD